MTWLGDLLFLVGAAAVVNGCNQWSSALAWVVGGLMAMAFGAMAAMRRGRSSIEG